jgi:hypothetical protein
MPLRKRTAGSEFWVTQRVGLGPWPPLGDLTLDPLQCFVALLCFVVTISRACKTSSDLFMLPARTAIA